MSDKTKKYDTPDAEDILTVAGTFRENVIYSVNDEKFKCCTYSRVREVIEGKFGVFNLKYNSDIQDWIVFQYILLDGPEDISMLLESQ